MFCRLVFLLAATSAAAGDGCDDLWLSRNVIMDNAGYCFASALGQAIFDNAACLGKSVSLPASDEAVVARIKVREAEQGCHVDTSQPDLDVDLISLRLSLMHQPVRDLFESACLGWLGRAAPLHAGHDSASPVVGQIPPGSNVLFAHEPVGTWTYVTVSGPDWVSVSGGWLDRVTHEEHCAEIAG